VTIRNARRIRPVEIIALSVALLLTTAAWMRCAPQSHRSEIYLGSKRTEPATPAVRKMGEELLARLQAELGADWKLDVSFDGEIIYFGGINETLRFDPPTPLGRRAAGLTLCLPPPLPEDVTLLTTTQGGYVDCPGETDDRRLLGGVIAPREKVKLLAAVRRAFDLRWGPSQDGLRCRLEPAAQKVRIGEEVKLTLVIQNHGRVARRLPDPAGGPSGAANLTVVTENERTCTVLDPPDGAAAAGSTIVLKPGEACTRALSIGAWKSRASDLRLSAVPGQWEIKARCRLQPDAAGEVRAITGIPVSVEVVDDKGGTTGAAKTVRVAAVQMASRFADPAANRDKMEKLAREAAKGGAKIIVFPEAAVQGYVSPKFELWTDPKRRPGEGKSLEGFAEPADGESAKRFGKLAGELKTYMVVPFIERDEVEGGGVRHFNSLLLFGPDGKRLLHYRKINPWPRAEATWAADGDRGLAFVDTEYGRLGLLICYDVHSVAAKLAAEKVDTLLYAIAWVDLKPERWFGERLPEKAKALGVNIVAANWTFPADDRLVDRGYGYSRVIGKDGTVLAAAKDECGEEIVYADLPVPENVSPQRR